MKLGTIVTGHGEVQAVPILVRRIAATVGVHDLQIPKPFRVPEGKLKKQGELDRAVRFVASLVESDGGILILLDCDDGCPAAEAPARVAAARAIVQNARVELVMAKCEYEAWFLAAAESLAGKRTLPPDLVGPPDAETVRDAKGWLSAQMKTGYSETVDQPALSAILDMDRARARSSSFDKLVRAVTSLLDAGPPKRPGQND